VLTRALRIINVSIALVALLIAFAIYWLAFRPLPKTSGDISAPIASSAVVKRDARGVPHIEAGSWQDAIFLQGYVTAQDRLWQMDGIRRFAAGDLSEVFGPGMLAIDERSRRMQIREIAERDLQKMPQDQRAVMVEYARGVNYFIETHRGNYSLEFSLPGRSYDPQPWAVSDCILVGLVMFRNLTDSADDDYERGLLVDKKLDPHFDPARFHILFPPSQGQYLSPGSNSWAVSGAHTADGKPMLANDPHLEPTIPGTWYMAHLKAPGLDVSGVTLPGVPSIISGHNENIAWGVTNLQTDALDLYQEQLDTKTGRYQYKGASEQAQLDRQTIAVKGAKPVAIDTWVTRHGPVIVQEGDKVYSMRWTAADGFGFPFMEINRAANFAQFRAALSVFWGPTQNFEYADKAGNIGYQAAGRVPVRRNFDGDFPVDGASGNFEWDGYIPYEQMPTVYNPPSGIIATANQRTFPPDYPFNITGSFADKYRIDQIRALLSAKPKLTVEDMLAVQKDVYSAYDHFLAWQIIAAYQKVGSKNDLAAESIALMRKWDGQMDKADAAPVVTELVSGEMGAKLTGSLNLQIYEVRVPYRKDIKRGQITSGYMHGYDRLPRPQIIEQMLRTRPQGWVAQDNWDKWIMDCFDKALNAGRSRLGSPVSKWRWGQIMEWRLDHPVGKELPLVDGLFDIGPVEMSGSGTTVKQTAPTLGPSERMVVDFGDLDKSVQNLVVGESGFVASEHYKDEWPAYYSGTSFPMQFEHVNARETLRVNPSK
jgi:penicillin amidase